MSYVCHILLLLQKVVRMPWYPELVRNNKKKSIIKSIIFPSPGGTEQEVSDARRPDPAVLGDVHLHQLPRRVREVHALAGPLRHHPHHLQASDARGIHVAGLHRPGFGLQVSQQHRCAACSQTCREIVMFTHITIMGPQEPTGNTAVLCLFSSDTDGWKLSKKSTQTRP